MKRKKFPVMNMGSALILTVFVILALVTFASLSLVTANSDYQFSRQIADRTSDYYEASNHGQEYLSLIAPALHDAYQNTGSREAYFEACQEALREFPDLTVAMEGGAPSVSYAIPMKDQKELKISLEITYPQSEGGLLYRVTDWREISVNDWNPDNKLNLIQIQ